MNLRKNLDTTHTLRKILIMSSYLSMKEKSMDRTAVSGSTNP